ncbi:hypothetical protein [Desulfonatronum thioautotrophicum]|uniref:hypothetical protein n=1 Tax=Desulfonatronum thioautotrophicum TaxID=617001 RepID=UPI001294736B|nr:hypothetical protein [Desulfonatronum thioautotrophicum]
MPLNPFLTLRDTSHVPPTTAESKLHFLHTALLMVQNTSIMINIKFSTITTFLIQNRNAVTLTVVYSLALFIILDGLYHDIIGGGNPWKQGDWLINNHELTVRRGFFGSSLLVISSFFDIPVLYLLGYIQAAIVSIIFVFFWYVGLRHRNCDILTFLLISPVFLIFWANDLQGGLRKELLAYLAFLPLLYGIVRDGFLQSQHILVSLFLWVIAVVAHEANVFFTPFLVFLIFIGYASQGTMRSLFFYSFAFVAISASAFVFALTHSGVESFMDVCRALQDAGLNQHICHGAIRWLEYDFLDKVDKTQARFFSWDFYYFLVTCLLMCSFIVVIFRNFHPKRALFFFFIANMFFLPLYITAIDWGRWVSFGMFTFISVFIAVASQNGTIREIPRMSSISWVCILLFCMVFGVHHGGVASFEYGMFKTILQIFF